MMKFENVAEIGDTIKAFDFMPMPDREDSFLIGRVIEKGMVRNPESNVPMFDGYTVEIVRSVTGDEKYDEFRKCDIGYIPFELFVADFDDRVSLYKKAGPSDDEFAAIGKEILGVA
jgi:hypothetical protein